MFVADTKYGIQLSPYDPELEKAMAIYREGGQKFRQALKELAK